MDDFIDWKKAKPICEARQWFEKGAPPGHRDYYSDTCRRYGGKLSCTLDKAIPQCDKHPVYKEPSNLIIQERKTEIELQDTTVFAVYEKYEGIPVSWIADFYKKEYAELFIQAWIKQEEG